MARTKLAFVADVHVANHRRFGGPVESGLNDRCRRVIEVLRAAHERAAHEGAAALIIPGDLFDNDHPRPQMIAAVQDAIGAPHGDESLSTVALVGNHDQHSADVGDHALGPLRDRMRIVDQPTLVPFGPVEVLCIPYVPGAARDWFADAVASLVRDRKPAKRILAAHLGVSDSKTAPWLRDASDAIHAEVLYDLMKEHDITATFAGNWHDARSWKFYEPETETHRRIEQCGALVPTGWDNPGLEGYGHLVLWDASTNKVSRVELPGPRFLKCYGQEGWDEMLPAIQKARDAGCAIYMSVTGEPHELPALNGRASEETAVGRYVEVEVLADSTETEVAARAAASAARGAEKLSDALAKFVESMPLDEEVDRQRVHDLARRYLGVQ